MLTERAVSEHPAVLILNGPNLNMLGTREPEIYGSTTLADIEDACRRKGADLGLRVECRQSNAEGELVGWVQDATERCAALIVNAGAYTHTSIALLDALRGFAGPILEVHLSNIYQREPFRHTSYVSQAADGILCGLGPLGYELALEAAARRLGTAGR